MKTLGPWAKVQDGGVAEARWEYPPNTDLGLSCLWVVIVEPCCEGANEHFVWLVGELDRSVGEASGSAKTLEDARQAADGACRALGWTLLDTTPPIFLDLKNDRFLIHPDFDASDEVAVKELASNIVEWIVAQRNRVQEEVKHCPTRYYHNGGVEVCGASLKTPLEKSMGKCEGCTQKMDSGQSRSGPGYGPRYTWRP